MSGRVELKLTIHDDGRRTAVIETSALASVEDVDRAVEQLSWLTETARNFLAAAPISPGSGSGAPQATNSPEPGDHNGEVS